MSKIKTSKLKAITPGRWGYRKVDVVFGRVRPSRDQRWAISGDLIQSERDGTVWEFQYRKDDMLHGWPFRDVQYRSI